MGYQMKKAFVLIMIMSMLTLLFTACENHYTIASEDSYFPYNGAVDIYNASREDLIELDLCNYNGTFGKVESEKEAVKIAAKVIKEVYGKEESPYIVKFNKNANAFIVRGSLPWFAVGGVASIAIDKETGEVLMLIHTK